jgi:Xaa-Pro aminopeptidase
MMDEIRQKLEAAEQHTKQLFSAIEKHGLIVPGKSERVLNDEIVALARDEFGINTFWHKKIVRAGINTQEPYGGNPPDVVMQDDDIVIADYGPVVDGWEADFAKTYIIGNDSRKIKLKEDTEAAWHEANDWYGEQEHLTGAVFYNYITALAARYGYTFGGEIAGHIVGPYPHEQLEPGNLGLDIHPGNNQDMFATDPQGNKRNWILEMHFVDRHNRIGGFFEQLLT